MITIPTGDWDPVVDPPPTALTAARLELHWAAQVVPAVGDAFLEPTPDDSHTSMTWREDLTALAGCITPQGFGVGLGPSELGLLFLDAEGEIAETFELEGRTLVQAFDWVAEQIEAVTGAAPTLTTRDHEIPDHPLGDGAVFGEPTPAHDALATWFENAARALAPVAASEAGASPVRCWPHNFDIATLITLDATAGRFIGVGLSPGDHNYAEPYFYCNPFPTPKDLPSLANHAIWHTDGFTSAVLRGSAIATTPAAAGDQVAAYLTQALEICHELLAR